MENISNRIKQIRKIKQRSLHDCAKLLEISKEDYLQFEEGQASLSLPELELLAIFLEVPPEMLLDESDIEFDNFSLLQEGKKSIFVALRNKMIGAQLAFERTNNGISLDELNENTGISLEVLLTYEDNNASIPLNHLFLICNELDLDIKSLLLQENFAEMDGAQEQIERQPEFSKVVSEFETEDTDLYQEIIRGMKRLPEEDQADIAKFLLKKLKSL